MAEPIGVTHPGQGGAVTPTTRAVTGQTGPLPVSAVGPVPLVGPVFAEISARFPGLETSRLVHESIRRLIDLMATEGSKYEFLFVAPALPITGAVGSPTNPLAIK